jgi:hypothetical protein
LVIATIMPMSTKMTIATCIHIHVGGIDTDSLSAAAAGEPGPRGDAATIV